MRDRLPLRCSHGGRRAEEERQVHPVRRPRGRRQAAHLAFCEDEDKTVKNPTCIRCGRCVEACPVRALDFGEIEDLRAKYGDVAEIAPLPEASLTKPNLVITAPAQAKPADDTTGTVENEVELV